MSEVRVEKVKNRIWINSSYGDKDRVKSISGTRWNATEGLWTGPLDFSTCQSLRQVFGQRLKIGPELWEWASAESKRRVGIVELAARDSADVASVEQQAPRLAAAMANRTYQQVGAAFMATAGACMNADQPGLGKTLQAIGAVIERGITGIILVMAPKAAAELTWEPELHEWVPFDHVVQVAGKARPARERAIRQFYRDAKKDMNRRHWLVCNGEMARVICDKTKEKNIIGEQYPELFKYEWEAVVVDESQRFLITRSARRKDQSLQRQGFGLLPVVEGGARWPLSGTPFRGKPENLWGTLNWMNPELYTSFWRWAEDNFEVLIDSLTGHQSVGDMLSEDEEAFFKKHQHIIIRRTKEEVAKDLPPKQYAGTHCDPTDDDSPYGVWLDMLPEQRKLYGEMVEHAAVALEGGSLTANGVLPEMTRLKQFATSCGKLRTDMVWEEIDGEMEQVEKTFFEPQLPSNKFNWILNWVDERGWVPDKPGERAPGSDRRVIIASQYTQLLNLFSDEFVALGIGHYLFTGQTSPRERKRIKDEFMSGEGHGIFFLNTTAGGVSLTLDIADELTFLDETWVVDDQIQVEDRIHRVSRMHQVTINYLRSRDSIEERIAWDNTAAGNLQYRLLDKTRGVDYARKLIGVQ